MLDIKNLNASEILSDQIFLELLEIESEIEAARFKIELQDRAKTLKIKPAFDLMLRAFEKQKKEFDREQKKNNVIPINNGFTDGITHFIGEYTDLYCGQWICTEQGVYCITIYGEQFACPHPIMLTKILTNAETGFVKVQIAYKMRGRWKEVVVDKEVIASASKIITLSKFGVLVNSENAKYLVKYLTDIEALNTDYITEQISTSKLGWINGEFMPYGQNIVFDNEQNLKGVFDSIEQVGDREKWYNLFKKLRKQNKIEFMSYIAASFGSILVEPINALPFIVNLWGDTGKGKTVALMLAASVWANPQEGHFMSDAKATDTALEIRLNFLNNLPMLIDDMAQIKQQLDGDFSGLIYRWCAGKGKDRATKTLGMNATHSWKNITITNAEHSLITSTTQGGAINRIIDVEMSDGYIFENGNEIVEILKQNYGYAGKEFVQLIQSMSKEELQDIQKGFYKKIVENAKFKKCEKEEKQVLPMSILLTADYLIEKYLFQDGINIDFNICVNLLKDKGEVSENERAYQFVLNEVQMNMSRFSRNNEDITANECWGMLEEESNVVIINGNAFKKILDRGNFSEKSFLSWAIKNNLVETDSNGNPKKNKRIGRSQGRCVFLKLSNDIKVSEDGFVYVDENTDLPFT